ncbi:Translation factor guf1 mitochondrial [Homalodisca vitripennis]|nr:Translation factor guf1 mitochondrial [Homalodisca vitripennis]
MLIKPVLTFSARGFLKRPICHQRFLLFINQRCSSNRSESVEESTETRATAISTARPEDIPQKNIRNFSIIAHVDHGKSTLADRLLEMTGTLEANPENKQVLDRLQVERERGITVKAQTASLFYHYKGEEYLLNLIDTPGHVDFSNEVSRSLASCQGVILLVDANQGVQAQTVANFYLAFNRELAILPVLNKIDLKNAKPDQVKDQLFNLFTIDPDDVLMISAKIGTGVDSVLEALVTRVPPPSGSRTAPLRALVFDSWYDRYRGAVALVYIHDGVVQPGDEVSSHHSKRHYIVKSVGVLKPHEQATSRLGAGRLRGVQHAVSVRGTHRRHTARQGL